MATGLRAQKAPNTQTAGRDGSNSCAGMGHTSGKIRGAWAWMTDAQRPDLLIRQWPA